MKKPFLSCLVLTVFSCFIALAMHAIFSGMKPWLDENPHGDQIYLFFTGRFEHHPMLTTFATYHLAVAYLAKLGGAFSIDKLRIISTVISLPLVITAFGYAYKQTGTASVAALRAMQVFLLPIYFRICSFFIRTVLRCCGYSVQRGLQHLAVISLPQCSEFLPWQCAKPIFFGYFG